MPKANNAGKGGRAIEVDFTGVESGGGFSAHVPEGDYKFKVIKVVKKTGADSGADYLLFDLKLTAGDQKGINKTIKHTASLKKNALWNLRNLLEACGKAVPSKSVKINLDNLLNLEGAATLVDDEYDGKKKSVVGSFFPVSEFVEVKGKKAKEEPAEDEEAAGDEEEETTEAESTEEEDEAEELFS